MVSVTPACGDTVGEDNPVVRILSDVSISGTAKCVNGDQQFTTQDGVHFDVRATFNEGNERCLFHVSNC